MLTPYLKKMTQYNWLGSLIKALVKGSVFALPVLMTLVPEAWLNITLGTMGYMLIDFLQKRFTTL